MPARIEALTDAQRARMPEWADHWIKVGLQTGPADRKTFESAVAECYRYAGLTPPKVVVWCPSPLVAVIAGPIAASVLGGAAVRDSVDGAVSGAVGDAVGAAVSGAVPSFVKGNWLKYLGGQFWVIGYWYGPAYVSFFRDVCGLTGDWVGPSLAYQRTVESACWWWPHRDFVMVSERPSVIRRELVDQSRPRGWGSHRLHCEDGPAVAWDGWGVYAWHGVRVPAEVIERPETITAERINAEENVEVKRAMIERIGWDRYLDMTQAVPVHQDDFGHLYRLSVGEVDCAVVVVENSTPEPDGRVKKYGLQVPLECQTAHAAVAATFGMTADEYRPTMET